MSRTSIEWTEVTWNPVTGCDRVSAGCEHCYALTLAKRLKAMGSQKYQSDGDPRTSGPGFGLTVHPQALDEPKRWDHPRLVFVNSMSDLFHARVPLGFVREVFDVMRETPQHTYQVLTKRSLRLRRMADQLDWPGNVWMGVSVENADVLNRIDHLREVDASVRFLSCEPILGPLGRLNLDGMGWVIVGGESGPKARPMHLNWARELRDQCVDTGVPFLFKQHGQWSPSAPLDGAGRLDYRNAHTIADDDTLYAPGDLAYPDGPRYGEALRAGHNRRHLHTTFRVGKKVAGRELDGKIWDQYPPLGRHPRLTAVTGGQ